MAEDEWSQFQQSVREDLKQLRAEYLDERKLLIGAEHSAIDSFSKAMLTLSATSLGFSLTLIRLVGGPVHFEGWLYAAWIFFAISVLTTVAAGFSSHKAHRASRVQLGQEYNVSARRLAKELEQPAETDAEPEPAMEIAEDTETAETIDFYNRCAFTCLGIGIACLLVFSFTNIPTHARSGPTPSAAESPEQSDDGARPGQRHQKQRTSAGASAAAGERPSVEADPEQGG